MAMIIILLLSCIFTALVSSEFEEFYIVLSSSDPCVEGMQCLTLSQFISRNVYVDFNVALYFHPGNHTLSYGLAFGRVNVEVMTSNNFSTHTSKSMLTCNESGSLNFDTTESANIYDMQLRGCHLAMFDASVNVMNSVFFLNINGLEQRAYLGYVWGRGKAGVVVSQRSSVTISNCTFERNQAELGAAIFAVDSVVEINNSSFLDNQVICRKFLRKVCLGGVLYSYNSNITIQYSNFQNNSAGHVDSHGGVFALFESPLSIYNNYFAYNNATWGSGGVLYAQSTNANITSTTNSFFNNMAAQYGGVIRSLGTTVTDTKSHFENNKAGFEGGVVFLEQATLTFSGSIVQLNSAQSIGGAIRVYRGTLHLYKCELSENSATESGGAVSINSAHLIISRSNFTANSAVKRYGGAIHAVEPYSMSIRECTFLSNEGQVHGGALYIEEALMVLIIKFSVFTSNAASIGGVIYLYREITLLISNSTFSNNSATQGGVLGVYRQANANVTANVFENNYAVEGGVVHVTDRSLVHMHDVIVRKNTARSGMMYFIESIGIISGYSDFTENNGSLFAYNSNITIAGNVTFEDHFSLSSNISFSEGGVITAFQSRIVLHRTCSFKNNFAVSGGVIRATESQVYVTGSTIMSNNTAEENGGGIFLYHSELNCHGSSILSFLDNIAGKKGGAIHAISSSIKVSFIEDYFYSTISRIIFTENHSIKGGAVSLEVNAKLYIFIKLNQYQNNPHTPSLMFTRNEADHGGAIYVADDTNSGICASSSFHIQASSTECFLQPLSLTQLGFGMYRKVAATYTFINFTNNTGRISGAAIYGGLLDRCTVSPFSQLYPRNTQSNSRVQIFNSSDAISGLKLLKIYSNIELIYSSISSKPVRVCFCNSTNHPDCDYQPSPIQTKKGRKFELSLVTVDQIGTPLSNITVLSSLSSNLGGLGVNQSNQTTGEGCTSFQYEVFSPHTVEELHLYAAGPCNEASLSKREVLINFTDCECPIGFQPKTSDNTNCVCECDSKLDKYIESCDFDTSGLLRRGNPWINYITSIDNSSNGYLIYPHCPFDYCYPPGSNIWINLNQPNGSDAQCQNARTGLLCGACEPDFSLSLGTIHCVPCPSYWPALLTLQLIGYLIAGIVIVMIVLMLDLTVAIGTINGVIFYGNILYNFVPAFITHSRITFASVIVSWLNLELGFDSCFFKGMDAYTKTWIELFFSMYVICLVIIVIVISELSEKFSHFIGKRNPVATLATLILLSYAKIFNTIIKALSFAIISYPRPDGPTRSVQWLPDASVDYFRGKHIPLGIVALLLLIVCVIFTALVFFWQWLAYFDNNRFVRLIKKQKMSHFIETYHAPYTPRNRYWTGLLLIVRMVLYAAWAINVSGNPNVNILIAGLVLLSLLLLKEVTGINSRIYKKWPIEILEISIHLNIVVLCFSVLYANVMQNKNAKVAITNTSAAIVFLQFIGIICYHVSVELIAFAKKKRIVREPTSSQSQAEDLVKLSSIAPTSTVVDSPKRLELHRKDTIGTKVTELREPLLDSM